MPDRDDAAVRTATDSLCCLHVQNQAGPGRCDRADVDTFDIKKGAGPLAPATARVASSIGPSRVTLLFGSLVADNSKSHLSSLLRTMPQRHQNTLPALASEVRKHAHL